MKNNKKYEEFMNDENNHDLQPDEAYDCGWGDCKETVLELINSKASISSNNLVLIKMIEEIKENL